MSHVGMKEKMDSFAKFLSISPHLSISPPLNLSEVPPVSNSAAKAAVVKTIAMLERQAERRRSINPAFHLVIKEQDWLGHGLRLFTEDAKNSFSKDIPLKMG